MISMGIHAIKYIASDISIDHMLLINKCGHGDIESIVLDDTIIHNSIPVVRPETIGIKMGTVGNDKGILIYFVKKYLLPHKGMIGVRGVSPYHIPEDSCSVASEKSS